ncbi:MAG: hypothetical protein A2X78_03480 [Gammaproteobacteria bacterium GWE2_37_16]|nr:MAG: hypothetical protein A2X78_03480 [Gammaproteobacteria bacterium GWE2_37_16]
MKYKNSKFLRISGLFCLLCLHIGISNGATSTASLTVSVRVRSFCTVTAPTALAFPDITDLTVGPSGTTNITLKCTKGTTVNTIKIDSANKDGSGVRRLKDTGTNYLSYVLYQTTGLNFTSGTSTGTCTVGGTVLPITSSEGITNGLFGVSTAFTIPVCGKINDGQDVPVGAYSDSATITVDYT